MEELSRNGTNLFLFGKQSGETDVMEVSGEAEIDLGSDFRMMEDK